MTNAKLGMSYDDKFDLMNKLKGKGNKMEKDNTQEIREKIIHILGIYPIISPTMLQSGLGPYTKPAVWRPVLAELIEAGEVVEDQVSLQTPADRYNTYTLLKLPGAEVKWV